MASRPGKTKYPKLTNSRTVPDEAKALLSKLVRDPDQPMNKSVTERPVNVTSDFFDKISKATAQDSVDAKSVFQLLPDVELAEQILVGSIISPKDMVNVELNYTVSDVSYDSEVARPLLTVVEEYFKHDYKIDDQLDLMLEEALFTKGAHILLTLPENNLDQLINGRTKLSMEHFDRITNRLQAEKPLGILGHPREPRVSLESYHGDAAQVGAVSGVLSLGGPRDAQVSLEKIQVTDNFNLLKTPAISARRRKVGVGDLIKRNIVSMESASRGLTPAQIDKLYQREQEGTDPTKVVVPQHYMSRPSVGHPLVMKLPTESVIPVYVPGDPTEHVGYFILIDPQGRPLVKEEGKDYYGELRNNFKSGSQDNSSEMVRKVKEAMGGAQARDDMNYDKIQEAYTSIIENDLLNRLRNGVYGEDYNLHLNDDVMRIMLYRALKTDLTRLVYVPAELVTYIAFEYNKDGIGTSLLTQSKILSSMRSVLMFAETMSGVRNAIGRKRANITVDPDDPDPQKTISDVQSLILESSHRGFPLGSPDPGQTLDFLNRAGFDFSINVESDNYPTTKVEFDDYNTQVNAGNPELSDRLRRMHISGMGINPELVDPTQSPDFAVSVVNNNLMMTRRVMRYQKHFTVDLTKFVRVFTKHSSILREKLLEALKENKKRLSPDQRRMSEEEVLEEFIEAIEVSLPSPDTTRIDQQLQSFEQYNSLLDRALNAYINVDLFPAEMLAREPDLVQHVISVITAHYQRLWLERNNVLPELDRLTEMDGRKPAFSLLDLQEGHFDSLGNAVQKYLEGIKKRKEAWEKKYGESQDDGFGGDDSGAEDTDNLADNDTGDDTFGYDDEGSDTDDSPDAEGETEETDEAPLELEEETSEEEEETNDDTAEEVDEAPLEFDEPDTPEDKPKGRGRKRK